MNMKLVAEKTFNLLKGFGYEVSSYNKEGDLVIDPMEATRFAVESPNILVRIDPLDKHLSLKTGTPGESIEKIRPMLKELAQDYLLDFDYSVFDKQIKPKGEKVDVAKKSKEEFQMSEDMNILKKLAGIDEGSDSTSSRLGQEAEQKARAEKYYNEMKELGITSQANEFMAKFKQLGNVDQALEAVGYFKSFDESDLDENPLLAPPGAELKFGQDTNQLLGFSAEEDSFYKMLKTFYDKDQLEIVDPISNRPKKPKSLDPDIARLAYNDFYKKGEKDPVSAYAQASAKIEMRGYRAGDFSEQDNQMEASTKTVNGCTVYSDGRPLNFADWRKETEMEVGRPMFDKVVQTMAYDAYINRCKANSTISDISEASLGKMTGSRKSSYQPLADNVKIIVRHNKDVNEEVRGARSRNIHSILIQRGEEKFKMAENNLSAARAMARHLHSGGETFDEIGEAITEMSREFKKLKEFVNYVKKANLVNETNEEFVTMAMENINTIKTNFKRLSGVKSYANAVESVLAYNNVELLQDNLDLESKFTETHFDDKVANVMDTLKASASRKNSFENKITRAIELESFEGLKDLLKEDDLLEFETMNQQLGHKVSSLGYSAKDETLGNYLHSISSKLNAGGQLSQFEYGAIKSSLLSAGQHNVQNAPMNIEESYEAFMDRFVD